MVLKIINATEAKPGISIMVESAPCLVRSLDLSKTGKHGAKKARIEAIGMIDGKKRILLKPGHEKLMVPNVDKRKGQVISVGEKDAEVMDVETFETMTIDFIEDVKETIAEGSQVEYWDIEGMKIIKRVI